MSGPRYFRVLSRFSSSLNNATFSHTWSSLRVIIGFAKLIFVLLIGATLFIGLSTVVAFCLRVRELRAKARTDLGLDPDGVTPLDVQLLPTPNAI